jgi:hypothetical protein
VSLFLPFLPKVADSMAVRSPSPSRDQMLTALESSGYLLEQRVERVLQRHGYKVESNPVYPDLLTGKQREFDIFATRHFDAGEGTLNPALVCECKNNAYPVVLFARDVSSNPTEREFDDDIWTSGLPGGFWTGTAYCTLPSFADFGVFHHYYAGQISTQYCSFKPPKQPNGTWTALHDEQHHLALDGLLQAVEHMTDTHYESLAAYSENLEEAVECTGSIMDMRVYYPVVVLQGALYTASLGKGRPRLRRVGMGRLRLGRPGPRVETRFSQVDVVTESCLSRYLAVVERDVTSASERLGMEWCRDSVSRTFDKLAAHAQDAQKNGVSLRRFVEPVAGLMKHDPMHNWPMELTKE